MKVSILQTILANRFGVIGIAAVVGLVTAWLIHDVVLTHDRKMRPLLIGSVANISLLALIWAGEFAFQKVGWLPAALAWIPQICYLPLSIGLVVYGLVRRSGVCVSINGVAAAFVAVVMMGAHFTSSPALAAGHSVRVLTYDVDHWPGGASPVAKLIEETHPAVICLQNSGYAASGHGHPLDDLRKALSGYQFTRKGDMTIGAKNGVHVIASKSLPPGSDDAPALIASVDGHPITFIDFCLLPCDTGRAMRDPGGYFANFTHDRDDQARELLAIVQSIHGQVVVCGDFNGPTQVSGSRLLSTKLRDAFDDAGNGYGYTTPASAPCERADRILLGSGVSAESIWSPSLESTAPASTHLPVVADLAISSGSKLP